MVIDTEDAAEAHNLPVPTLVTATLMRSREDSARLASETLAFAQSLRHDATKSKGVAASR